MGYVDATTIYTVIPEPLSRASVIISLHQYLAAINSWCLKWHMRLNPRKAKSMMVSRSRTRALGYVDLTLGSTEFEEVKSLRNLWETLDSKLTFGIYLLEVVSKATRNLGIVRR